MSKSQQTFRKKELAAKKVKQRKEKAEKMLERKANGQKATSLESMMAYLDENGNLTLTPPPESNLPSDVERKLLVVKKATS